MLILSEINNHIMLMLKSIQDWLLNLVSMFLCSLTDHRWLMFYIIILLTVLLNVYKKDGRDSVVNKEQNDRDERVTDYEEEDSDEDNEDENIDDNNNNNNNDDNNGTSKKL